jgi:hypothetical protein
MGRLLFGLMVLAASGCARPAASNEVFSNETANVAAPAANAAASAGPVAATRGVDDPRALVERQYQAYLHSPDAPVAAPAFAYSDRLKALFDDYDRWQQAHQDTVGSLDFDWWINAQDWQLSNVTVTQADTGADAKTVTSHFRNADSNEEVRFLFVRRNGRWYLDDAVQGSGHGDDGWTLSALLRARE